MDPMETLEILEGAAEGAADVVVESVDLTPVIEQLQRISEYLHVLNLGVLILAGLVLGCALVLVLAVMFR